MTEGFLVTCFAELRTVVENQLSYVANDSP